MPTGISNLASVHPDAQIGEDVFVGPFCVVGPQVSLGDGCRLDSNVVITGSTSVGCRNRFWPGCVIGCEPQDISYSDADTQVVIGDDNQFREGVTVNRGAEKEDGVTRIDNGNLLMSNSHVAHNCHVFNRCILVNGVLLGGHVHLNDGAIISGNAAVHHFGTVGTLGFVSGLSKVTRDVPPYMLLAGIDEVAIRTINIVGMRRAGIPEDAIKAVKRAHRLLFREHKKLDAARGILGNELDGEFPAELNTLLDFMEATANGKSGRAREAVRNQPPATESAGRIAPADDDARTMQRKAA